MADPRQVRKIVGLQELARSNDKEHEVESALRLIEHLMLKHGVTQADIDKLRESPEDFLEGVHDIFENTVDAISFVAEYLGGVIAQYTHTKHYVELNFQTVAGPVAASKFFGYRPDVELALHVAEVFERAIELEWNKYSAFLPRGKRESNRLEFMLAMAGRLIERMDVKPETGAELVPLKNQLVLAEFDKRHPEIQRDVITHVVEYSFRSETIRAGYDAGDRVNFSRELSDT